MAIELLTILSVVALVVVPLNALKAGMEARRPYVRRLLGRPEVLARFCLAAFVVVPTGALALHWMTPLEWPVWIGLLLVAVSPPTPRAWERAVQLEGDLELSIAWNVVALAVSIVTVPLWILLLDTIVLRDLSLGIVPVVERILYVFLLPLAAGILLPRLWPRAADRLNPVVDLATKIGGPLLVSLVVLLGLPLILRLGPVGIFAVVAFVGVAILAGHVLGGPDPRVRPALVTSLALRSVAPAIILAGVNNVTLQLAPVILCYVMAGALLLVPYGLWLKHGQRVTMRRPR